MVHIRPLDAPFGAECPDIDLRDELSPAEWAHLVAAWDEHKLLVFRDQQLSGEQQHAFAARFGPVAGESAPWGYVSNVRPDGIVREGRLLFHSDFAFTATPTIGISLHALEVPSDGSPTVFADASAAAERLPGALRRRVDGRRVRNAYDFTGHDDSRVRLRTATPGSPWYDHPVVGEHPRTHRLVVFANEMHSDSIVGLDEPDSEAVLSELFATLYAAANRYEHRWTVGDLVLWDNIALHHGRPAFPVREARTLQRVVLAELRPDEIVPNLPQLLAARRR